VLAPSHTYLTHRRIVERCDILNALPQLVEHSDASLDECTAVWGRLYTPPAPIKQPYSESVLQVGNGLGDGGL